MKKICLINCFFGNKWPSYFQYFLTSCKSNPTVSFLFFTNLEIKDKPENVTIVPMTLKDFNKITSSKLGFEVNILEPYKLCDFKPAYGKIFEDYLQSFDYWGYCDIDLVFGNIRKFITTALLTNYQVISARIEYPAGFFTLYSNNTYINSLCLQSKDFKHIMQSKRHYCFDECNFMFNELFNLDEHILNLDTEMDNMAAIVAREELEGRLRYYHETIVEEFQDKQNKLTWKDGTLSNQETQQEYILTHLINVKGNIDFLIEKHPATLNTFYITATGISTDANISLSSFGLRTYLYTSRALKIMWYKMLFSYGQLRNNKNLHQHHVELLNNIELAVGNLQYSFSIPKENKLSILIRNQNTYFYQENIFHPISANKILCKSKTDLSLLSFSYANNKLSRVQIHNLNYHTAEVGLITGTTCFK